MQSRLLSPQSQGAALTRAQAGVLPKDKSGFAYLVVVANGSNRPICEVACKIEVMVLITMKLTVCSVPRTLRGPWDHGS